MKDKLKTFGQKLKGSTVAFVDRVAGRAKKLDKGALVTLTGIAVFAIGTFIIAAWLGFMFTGAALVAIGERG